MHTLVAIFTIPSDRKREEQALSFPTLLETNGRKKKRIGEELNDRVEKVENVVVGYDM